MKLPIRTAFAAVTVAAVALLGVPAAASAATVTDGPIDLGAAAEFSVLGASTVTNTGTSVLNGDLGVSPGTSLTGFPSAVINGTTHATDAVAAQAQADATTAYNVAASLTPTQTGIGELNGLSLTPGVYNGGALQLADNGILTLAGSAESVWVFQASSTLTIGAATQIVVTGGASACNVFWQVGSSATLGISADFHGTILAAQSVTATTDATVVGRLIARNAAVTLDHNTITTPTGCASPGTPYETLAPEITSGAPSDGTAGTPYSFTVTATGAPAPTYTVTGALPAGLTLDTVTGVISGTPSDAGTTTFTVTASNGIAPSDSETYTVTVDAAAPVAPAPEPTPAPAPSPEPSPGLAPEPAPTPGDAPTPAPGAGPAPTPAPSATPAPTPALDAAAAAAKTRAELARTGSDAFAPLAGGALLLLGGAALILFSRRRRLAGSTGS